MSEPPFIANYVAARARTWPPIEAYLRSLAQELPGTVDGFLERLAAGSSLSGKLEHAFQAPAVARIAYLPLWHVESYTRRGIFVPDPETLEANLTFAACTGFCAVRIWDDLVDEDDPEAPKDELLAAILFQLESFRRLQRIFDPDSTFWRYHDNFWQDYAQAVAAERRRYRSGLAAFDETALRLIGDKAAPLKSFPVAVAQCAGREDEIDRLNELMDAFNQATQLANDLQSLKPDLEARRYTLPIAGAALEAGYEIGSHPPTDGLYGAVVSTASVLETHDRAHSLFERARVASDDLGIPDLSACLIWHITDLETSRARWEQILDGKAGSASVEPESQEGRKGLSNGPRQPTQ